MEQKNGHAFKEEQIDWNALAKAGIGREQLEQDGNLSLLLQGRETGIISLRLNTPVEGRPVVEINGIHSEEKQHN